MRGWPVIAVCIAALAGCGQDGDAPTTGLAAAEEYGRALQRACQPIATALQSPDLAVLSTPDNTLVDDPEAFDRKSRRAIGIFMDAVDTSYTQAAALNAPPEHTSFAQALRADRDAVRVYTQAIRKAAAANVSASRTPVREPTPPRALRRGLPSSLATAAPACRRLFPITG